MSQKFAILHYRHHIVAPLRRKIIFIQIAVILAKGKLTNDVYSQGHERIAQNDRLLRLRNAITEAIDLVLDQRVKFINLLFSKERIKSIATIPVDLVPDSSSKRQRCIKASSGKSVYIASPIP